MIGRIVSVTRVGQNVVAAVALNEGDGRGAVEYVATVPAVDAQGNALSLADLKTVIIAEWQRQRALRPTPPVDLSGQINGNVNL